MARKHEKKTSERTPRSKNKKSERTYSFSKEESKKVDKKPKKTLIEKNKSLLNIISPMTVIVNPNEMTIGENICRIFSTIKYPPSRDYGWMEKLTNITGTVASILFTPIDNGDFLETLNNEIKSNRRKALESNDPLTVKRANRKADDAEMIMQQIDQHGEVVGDMAMSIMAMATEREAFNKVCDKVKNSFTLEKCRIRNLPYLQKEAFKTISPAYYSSQKIDQVSKTVVPLSTLIGGYPFASSGYNDQEGYLFGKDYSGGLVIVNPWKRGNDRTNSNFVIMGDSGQGKSATIKHLILMEYALGSRIIFIDPEREYKFLTQALNGDWINAGGDGQGRINPLQINPIQIDLYEDTEDEVADIGAMALHLKSVDVFFNLYFKDISDYQRAILKSEVIDLYTLFDITWDTDVTKLKNEDFPTFADLHELLVKKSEHCEEIGKLKEREVYDELAVLIKDLALGSDSFLWSGHSTLQSNSQCVCLDTFDLNGSSDTIKSTQYFNLLNWAWNEMSRDRNERILLICDEAYLMIDERVPQSLVFLRNAMKRARKYEAGIIIASHGVVDFLSPSVKQYGQALLDQPCYKIMLGTDGQNLKETKYLYNLTEAEEEVLLSKQRGRGIVMFGHDRVNIHFTIPDYKFGYFGGHGGR